MFGVTKNDITCLQKPKDQYLHSSSIDQMFVLIFNCQCADHMSTVCRRMLIMQHGVV